MEMGKRISRPIFFTQRPVQTPPKAKNVLWLLFLFLTFRFFSNDYKIQYELFVEKSLKSTKT